MSKRAEGSVALGEYLGEREPELQFWTEAAALEVLEAGETYGPAAQESMVKIVRAYREALDAAAAPPDAPSTANT